MDELLNNSIKDPNASIMAIYGTPANKAAASRLYTKESLSNQSLSDPDSDDSRGKSSGTYNAASKPTFMVIRTCKLLQCEELHERLDCKSMEIKWYKYMRKWYTIR